MRSHWILVALLCCAVESTSASAQSQDPVVRFSTGVIPDRVTVGDRFRAVVRVAAPAGSRVEFPPLPERTDAIEPTDSVETLVTNTGEHVAVYRLVAWRTGEPTPPAPLPVRVVGPDGEGRVFLVQLPRPRVLSVLPADTTGIEPRGPKDLIEPPRALWPWIAAGAAALAVLVALLGWIWRRRRGRVPAVSPATAADPRGEALRALDEARRGGLVEAGEWKAFYSRVSGALRGYLAALAPEWSTDRTTRELLRRMREAGVEPDAVEPLRAVLEAADRVKFARHRPGAAEAESDWSAARAWVESSAPVGQLTLRP